MYVCIFLMPTLVTMPTMPTMPTVPTISINISMNEINMYLKFFLLLFLVKYSTEVYH